MVLLVTQPVPHVLVDLLPKLNVAANLSDYELNLWHPGPGTILSVPIFSRRSSDSERACAVDPFSPSTSAANVTWAWVYETLVLVNGLDLSFLRSNFNTHVCLIFPVLSAHICAYWLTCTLHDGREQHVPLSPHFLFPFEWF